ncbi:MAG: hypothetical protein AB7S70_09875 [Hyphomicrobium sp.]|uniref:hypothetical protein n=1 Tax=Hyphomicrobium sp. TaxID=82 RepID=UPI003D121442
MRAQSHPLRALARAALLLCCMVLVTAWRFGPPLTFFEEEGAIAAAVEQLRAAGGFTRVLSIGITADEVAVQAQDPRNPDHINRWRVAKHNLGKFNWQSADGPEPVPLNLINPDLEANLFDIADVDLGAAGRLAKQALSLAALDDAAAVSSMDIERQLLLLPNPSSGDVRWRVAVGSGRENASVAADAKGNIVRVDLAGTNRARTFDLLKSLEMLPEAATAFSQAAGTEPVLVKVRAVARGMTFETNVREKSALTASLKQRQTYNWSLNGLERSLGSIDTSEHFGADPAFAIGEVDWAAAGKLVQQARTALEMPDAMLDEIEVEKPKDQPAEPKIEWQIAFKDKNGEEGTARFDAKTGEVLGLELPESRRKPFDARDPALWPSFMAKIEATFGTNASIAELLINENQVTIVAADPQKPEELAEFLLDEEGIKRWGTVSPFALSNPRFTLAEIRSLTGEQMKKLIEATNARLKLPTMQIINITVGKAALDPSPQGNVTVEIRAEEGPFKRSGRVNWELDGREIKAYLP